MINEKENSTATKLEANYYMQLTRVEEVIRFAQEMEYHTIGIAHCIGLAREAEVIASIF